MSTLNSLKPVVTNRVSNPDAERVYSQSRILGHPLGCSRTAQRVHTDVYNRPSNIDTLNVSDAACSNFISPVWRRIAQENTHRPMLGPYALGERGKTDTMPGVARDAIPDNIYGRRVPFQNDYGYNLKRKDKDISKTYISEPSRFRKPRIQIEDALQTPVGY